MQAMPMAPNRGQAPPVERIVPEDNSNRPDQELDQDQMKAKDEIEKYNTVLMTLLHSEKTRDKVMDILSSGQGDIFTSVPQAAVTVNDMGVNLMGQSGGVVSPGTQLGSSQYLIEDLIQLGMAKGLWEEPTEEELLGLVEDTIQIVIERGLADGSIDPIQLQLEVEPLMNEDQKRVGVMMQEEQSMASEPSQEAVVDQYVNSQMTKAAERQVKRDAMAAAKNTKVNQRQAGIGHTEVRPGGWSKPISEVTIA